MQAEPILSATEALDRDKFIDRLYGDAQGAFNIFAVHIGDRLGFYRELSRSSGLTSSELAARTGAQERYVREWLEQQAAACVLEVADITAGPGERRYSLSPGRAEALVDRDSLNFIAPLAQLIAGAVSPLDQLLEAYRDGGGVPFSAYGANLREGQASMNRPMLLKQLGEEWIPTMPDVHARLLAAPPALIADVGCGAGWSCIGMARSYPGAIVHGTTSMRLPSIWPTTISTRLACRSGCRSSGAMAKASIWSGVTTWWLHSSASTTCPIRSGCCVPCAAC